jgi:hypothetical protein
MQAAANVRTGDRNICDAMRFPEKPANLDVMQHTVAL